MKTGIFLWYCPLRCPDCGHSLIVPPSWIVRSEQKNQHDHLTFEQWLGNRRVDFFLRSRRWHGIRCRGQAWPVAYIRRSPLLEVRSGHLDGETFGILKQAGIEQMEDVRRIGIHGLFRIKGIGPKRVHVLMELSRSEGFSLTEHGDTNPDDCICKGLPPLKPVEVPI